MSLTELIANNDILNKELEYEPFDNKPYECSICRDILDDPVSHSLCGNMFCRKCSVQVDKCPICKKAIQESELLTVPKLISNNLQVRCKHCSQKIDNRINKMKLEINEISEKMNEKINEIEERMKKMEHEIEELKMQKDSKTLQPSFHESQKSVCFYF